GELPSSGGGGGRDVSRGQFCPRPTGGPLLFASSVQRADLHSFPTRRSSDLLLQPCLHSLRHGRRRQWRRRRFHFVIARRGPFKEDRKSTRLNSSHVAISYAVFCLKKKSNHGPTSCAAKPRVQTHRSARRASK